MSSRIARLMFTERPVFGYGAGTYGLQVDAHQDQVPTALGRLLTTELAPNAPHQPVPGTTRRNRCRGPDQLGHHVRQISDSRTYGDRLPATRPRPAAHHGGVRGDRRLGVRVSPAHCVFPHVRHHSGAGGRSHWRWPDGRDRCATARDRQRPSSLRFTPAPARPASY